MVVVFHISMLFVHVRDRPNYSFIYIFSLRYVGKLKNCGQVTYISHERDKYLWWNKKRLKLNPFFSLLVKYHFIINVQQYDLRKQILFDITYAHNSIPSSLIPPFLLIRFFVNILKAFNEQKNGCSRKLELIKTINSLFYLMK